MSDQLVAGDIVSIGSGGGQSVAGGRRGRRGGAHDHDGGTHIPCDMLLLGGSAVLNEAVLTGESVPQIKEAVEGLIVQTGAASTSDPAIDESCRLDIEDPSHKRSVLFGGTTLVNATPASQETTGEINSIPAPPDGGLVTMVLRTASIPSRALCCATWFTRLSRARPMASTPPIPTSSSPSYSYVLWAAPLLS